MNQSASGLRLLFDEPMSRHTSLGVGGPADVFAAVDSPVMLLEAVNYARARGLSTRIIGAGTNLLVCDAGFRGMIIHNAIKTSSPFSGTCDFTGQASMLPSLSTTCSGGVLISVSSGVNLASLARSSITHALAGLEWAADIPGTIGGAIAGNSGAFGRDIAQSLIAVEVLDDEGKISTIPGSSLEFGYRSSPWKRGEGAGALPIIGAKILFHPGDLIDLERELQTRHVERGKTQPKGRSAGSVFRNPEGDSAGRLIDRVDLKGHRVGGAVISDVHANFIINEDGAAASDILGLISLCTNRVREAFGIELELELVILGEE